jgi:Nucleotidyltransferase of unknown function (DUF6036)
MLAFRGRGASLDPLDASDIRSFLTILGILHSEPEQLLLLGGCALILLGSARTTLDIDYVGDDVQRNAFQHTIERVAAQLHTFADPVPIEQFLPIPPGSEARRVFIGRFGLVDVFVLDPYVIALSKLERGLDTDIDDIVFLLERNLVNLGRLTDLVALTLMHAAAFAFDAAAVRRHLAVVRQRVV